MAEYVNVEMMYKTNNGYQNLYPITNDATFTKFDVNNTYLYTDVAQDDNPYITERYNFSPVTLDADNVASAYTEIRNSICHIGRKQYDNSSVNIQNSLLAVDYIIKTIYYNPLQGMYYAILVRANMLQSEIMRSSDGITFDTSVAVYNNRIILDVKFVNGYVMWVFYDFENVVIPSTSIHLGNVAKIHIGKQEDMSGGAELFNSSVGNVPRFINGLSSSNTSNRGVGFSVDCDGCSIAYAINYNDDSTNNSTYEIKGATIDLEGNISPWVTVYQNTPSSPSTSYMYDIRIKNIRPGHYIVYDSSLCTSSIALSMGRTLLFVMVDPLKVSSLNPKEVISSLDTSKINTKITDILMCNTSEYGYAFDASGNTSVSFLYQRLFRFVTPTTYATSNKRLSSITPYRMPLRFRAVQISDNYIWVGLKRNDNYLYFYINPIIDIYKPRDFGNGINRCKYTGGSNITFPTNTNCIDDNSLLTYIPMSRKIYFSTENDTCYTMDVIMK